jgi:hypothetical protein
MRADRLKGFPGVGSCSASARGALPIPEREIDDQQDDTKQSGGDRVKAVRTREPATYYGVVAFFFWT